MKNKPKTIICSLLGISLGIVAFTMMQYVMKDAMGPILQACSASQEEFAKTGYHKYEPLVGGPLSCLGTQFLHVLVTTYPEGFITWGVTLMIMLPVEILINVEAGRDGSKGFVRYPTIMILLATLIGISVIYPLFWVPAYCLGNGGKGAVTVARVYTSLLLILPGLVITFLLFTIDSNSYSWTFLSGLVLGPFLSCLTLTLWKMVPPKQAASSMVSKGANALSKAYMASGVLSFIWWVIIVSAIVREYGSGGYSAFLKGIWIEAAPEVAFMTIDAVFLFLGVLVYLYFVQGLYAVTQVLLWSPLIGPGASCALVMSSMERKRAIDALEKKEPEKKLV